MEKVISHFANKNHEYQVLILGGGTKEEETVNEWKEKYPQIISIINKLSFEEEISLIAHSKVVVSMDSANMHLASLLDTTVISIWGQTTPYCGYYPEKENINNAIFKNIDCQPCSIWGEKPCTNNNQYDCLNIDPSVIIEAIQNKIQ